jgi:hypothetical protein
MCCSIFQGPFQTDFQVSINYGDPFHLKVKYIEADFEFHIIFNHGEEDTHYSLSQPINKVSLQEIEGFGGMEVNFVGVAHEGMKKYVFSLPIN